MSKENCVMFSVVDGHAEADEQSYSATTVRPKTNYSRPRARSGRQAARKRIRTQQPLKYI